MDNPSNNDQQPIYPTPTEGSAIDSQAPNTRPTSQPIQQVQTPQLTQQPPQLQATPQQQPQFAQQPNLNNQPQQPHHENAGTIILQWLTYAFWGWTVLSMSFLLVLVLTNLIAHYDDGGVLPYSIAATLVLLPISLACDFLYAKKEPEKKVGAASIVMVIHAVLFALITIGSLIAIVFSVVELFIGSSNSSKIISISLYSEVIITILYAAVLLRVLNFPKIKWYRKFFLIFMTIVVGLFSILAIVGPISSQRATKTDRLIDDNLQTVQQAINDYYTSNSQLPSSLNQITLTGDAQSIVNQNLVTYIPNSKPSTGGQTVKATEFSSTSITPITYYYQLCVTYKKPSQNDSLNSSSTPYSGSTYSTYINTYSHPGGYYCYDAETSSY
jgi:type II secretory pathway pseudopilin PulG